MRILDCVFGVRGKESSEFSSMAGIPTMSLRIVVFSIVAQRHSDLKLSSRCLMQVVAIG